jgi:hypothetical protein
MALPPTKAQVLKGAGWLMTNFPAELTSTVIGKPYGVPIVCAIACKETGFIWIGRSGEMDGEVLLPLLIGDASGDVAGAPRNAFPKNTAAFRAKFGTSFTNQLIAEANKARALRGLSPAAIVYKGYGIFQYDLQHVLTDQSFFENRLWYSIGSCLERLTRELDRCFAAAGNDTRGAVRRYNGSGARAEQYADHVMAFADWCEELAP